MVSHPLDPEQGTEAVMIDNTQCFINALLSSTTDNQKSLEGSLSALWYSSDEMYEFERRAIFSKRWLFISHKSRLHQTGDWLRYSFANYDIIVTRDRTGAINTFHNVCRHRAYPVIEKEGIGNNKILACRYHGWSYGLNGKLAKAPGYQDMNLDRDQNSLFRCHTKIDRNGFIWINLDAKESPEVPWEEKVGSFGTQCQHSQLNFDDYIFYQERKRDFELNWKTGSIDLTPNCIKENFKISSTYCFPNVFFNISAKFIAIQKVFPQAPNKTVEHYEIYRQKDCSDAEFKTIRDAYSSAVNGRKITGVLSAFFKNAMYHAILGHYEQERIAGKEIWPSKPVEVSISSQLIEDEKICKFLVCRNQKEALIW